MHLTTDDDRDQTESPKLSSGGFPDELQVSPNDDLSPDEEMRLSSYHDQLIQDDYEFHEPGLRSLAFALDVVLTPPTRPAA